MKTAEYDFFLPEKLIAYRPPEKRDDSRLLVLHREDRIEHRRFRDLPSFLRAGDMLLLNKTKVFPARLAGVKPGGGRLEILLTREILPGKWEIMAKGRYTGPLRISEGFTAFISEGKTALFENPSDLRERIWLEGKMPLPPYIRRPADDQDMERYQTVYAETEGSFKLIKTDNIEDHAMERELFELDPSLPSEIEEVKRQGGRIIAVGTTTTRAVEGYMSGKCDILSSNGAVRGLTDIFIREGYRLKAVDAVITNFHLPRSTPLMLTSVFAGRERLLRAYESAISMGYRFFSYGDDMLVL
jgi:S-adenosylmethionine:tRNA ribosyltransferase-isomerase